MTLKAPEHLRGSRTVMNASVPKRIRAGLPPLVAPAHLAGRMSKWTPEHIRTERATWAAEQGAKGYSSCDVAHALGVAQQNAHAAMTAGGWDAWAHRRAQHHGAQV